MNPRGPRRLQYAAIALVVVCAVGVYGLVVARVNAPTRSASVQPLTAAQRTQPVGALDSPEDGAVVQPATIPVRGWAIDAGADSGTGVDSVDIYVDGQRVADASYGIDRPDISSKLGPRFGASGWSATVDATSLSPGNHAFEARAHSTLTGNETAYTRTVVVAEPTSAPAGALDNPEDGASVGGVVDVRGWAIDQASQSGPGVDQVQIYLDDALLGDATLGKSRPDVLEGFGPRFADAGFAARVDLTGQSVGEHQLEVRARSTLSGQETTYTHTISVALPPSLIRGALDNPPDAATVSSPVQVQGWAIDASATNGTGIDRMEVYVDGNLVAPATLGVDRPDIAQAYGKQFGLSGFNVSVDLTPGQHELVVRAHSSVDNTSTDFSHSVVVN